MPSTTVIVTLEHVTCSCGVTYGLDSRFIEARRKDKKTFFCPNGCRRHYPGKTKQEKEIERLERQVASLGDFQGKILGQLNALTRADYDLTKRAQSLTAAKRTAFWKGVQAMRCGCYENPYKTNAGGYQEAWNDGQAACLEVER